MWQREYHFHFMGAVNILKARTSIRHRLPHFRYCSSRAIAQGMLKLTSVNHLVPAPTQSRDNSVRLLRAFSSWGLTFSKGTTFSYKVFEPLFQCLTTFTVITFLLTAKKNFPCCNFCPFLSTCNSEMDLPSSSLHTNIRQWKTASSTISS